MLPFSMPQRRNKIILLLFLHGLFFLFGTFFGIALMCILQVGKQTDEQMEQLKPTQKEQEEFSE